MGAHAQAHVSRKQNECATLNRILRPSAAYATVIPQLLNVHPELNQRGTRNVWFRAGILTFGIVDEPHGGSGGPVLLDPKRQRICATQQPHVKSGAPTNQSQICAAAIQGRGRSDLPSLGARGSGGSPFPSAAGRSSFLSAIAASRDPRAWG